MKKNTFQIKFWQEKFGDNYIKRSPKTVKEVEALSFKDYGISRIILNKEFIGKIDKKSRILEVGCNTGSQLLILEKMGFSNLYGIEINKKAVEFSKSITKKINIMYGSVFDIPFKDNYFDLVFTSGVLIHISPNDIKNAMEEIYRVTKKYIWGLEYHADKYTEIPYRGKKNMLWKANFSEIYLKNFKDLELMKQKKLKYLDNKNTDTMFLLKKQ